MRGKRESGRRGRGLEAVEGARITVHLTLILRALDTDQFGHDPGPEPSRRQVGIEVENLPLTRDAAQEGRHDKLPDTLATKTSSDEQVADVVFGAVQVCVV